MFCVPGSKNHCAAGIAPIDPGFFVMRAPCHVGGRPAADMHSCMRVNGFLYTQSAVMCTRTKMRRVAWLGTGTSHPCGSVTKCSGPAEALNTSKTKTKMWNRSFMYKWRGMLLLLRGRFRLLTPNQSRAFSSSHGSSTVRPTSISTTSSFPNFTLLRL